MENGGRGSRLKTQSRFRLPRIKHRRCPETSHTVGPCNPTTPGRRPARPGGLRVAEVADARGTADV